MTDKKRQRDDLDKLRRQAEEAAAQLPDDEKPPATPAPTSPTTQAALQTAANAQSTYAMGASATREWKALAHEEFKKLREAKAEQNYPHTQKMVDTIVALVDARIAGQPETPVFDRPDACHANTYHSKWKHDPVFAECLDNVTELARNWHDGRALRALEDAAEKLALASPAAVVKATSLIGSQDANVALRAAFGILDRAGVQTATKQGGDLEAILTKVLENLDLTKLTDDQLRRVRNGEHPLKVILDDYVAD